MNINRDVDKIENYFKEKLCDADFKFLTEHLEVITDKVQDLELDHRDMNTKQETKDLNRDANTQAQMDSLKKKNENMLRSLNEAQASEKNQVERQKQYGVSQTMVENSRHAHIMKEIEELKKAGITNFNRSSYPSLPRHTNFKGKKK